MTLDYYKLLEEAAQREYPDYPIELGENWEIIAEIFYKLGRESVQADKQS